MCNEKKARVVCPPMLVLMTQNIFALRFGRPSTHLGTRTRERDHSDRGRPRYFGDDYRDTVDHSRSARIGLLSARRAYHV